MKLCAVAALAVALSLLGQESGKRYDALKQALGLSDAQLSQLQQKRPTGLDDSQRAKLAEIKKVWDRWDAAALAIEFGLIDEKQWTGGALCDFYPIRSYAYAKELGLSDAQAQQLEQLRQASGSRPRRDAARAVLDETQRAKLGELENQLQLASEAIDLRLIAAPARGEILCH